MGLDITAYRGLKPVKCDDSDNCWPKHAHLYFNDGFPDRSEGATAGCNEYAEEHGFRAGSYSGYNLWRDQLAELVGYPAVAHPGKHREGEMSHAAAAWHGSATPDASTRPFFELVNFSDCEGVIGPKVSAKLAADFVAHQAAADAHPDEWFRDKYVEWRKAFEMAADGGAVCFH